MGECSVLTRDRLERLLARRLEPADHAPLREHFAAPCEACLDVLAEVDEGVLMAALGGTAAELSNEEADQMFGAAMGATDEAPSVNVLRPPHRARRKTFVAALAAAAAVLLAVLLVPKTFESPSGEKGSKTAVSLSLRAWVAELREGSPAIVASFIDGDAIDRGQRLVFRYEIDSEAHLYFITESEGERRLLRHFNAGPGDRELALDGRTLALDPAELGAAVKIFLLASPAEVEKPELLECAGCSVAGLSVTVRGPR